MESSENKLKSDNPEQSLVYDMGKDKWTQPAGTSTDESSGTQGFTIR